MGAQAWRPRATSWRQPAFGRIHSSPVPREVFLGGGERIGKRLRIQGSFGDAGPDVWPSDEGCVTDEHNTTKRHAWGFEIKNGGKYRLASAATVRKAEGPKSFERPSGVPRLLPGGSEVEVSSLRGSVRLRRCTTAVRWNHTPLGGTIRTCIAGCSPHRRWGAIGMENASSPSGRENTMSWRVSAPPGGRDSAFLNHAAPSHIANIARHNLRHELPAHGGAHAVSADQQFTFDAPAIREHCDNPMFILLTPCECHVGVIVFDRERLSQGSINPVPCRGHFAYAATGHVSLPLRSRHKCERTSVHIDLSI